MYNQKLLSPFPSPARMKRPSFLEHLDDIQRSSDEDVDVMQLMSKCSQIVDKFSKNFPVYATYNKEVKNAYEEYLYFLIGKIRKKKSVQEIQQLMKMASNESKNAISNQRKKNLMTQEAALVENENLQRRIQNFYGKTNMVAKREMIKKLRAEKEELEKSIQHERNTQKHLYEGIKFSKDNITSLENRLHNQIRENKLNDELQLKEKYLEIQNKLVEMNDLVTKEEHEKAIQMQDWIVMKNNLLKDELESVKAENVKLNQEIHDLEIQVTPSIDLEVQVEEARSDLIRTSTPRPDLPSLKEVHDDIPTRTILSQIRPVPDLIIANRSTREVIDSMLSYAIDILSLINDKKKEIEELDEIVQLLDPKNHNRNGNLKPNDAPFFQGLGNSSSVPKYLRFQGQLRNKMLAKREVENLIEDIWKQRCKQTQASHSKSRFEDFFETYLATQFSNVQQVKREWAYSFIEGCRAFRSDPDCDMFLRVLEGDIAEETYHAQFQLIEKLNTELIRLDAKSNGRTLGKIKKSTMFRFLDKFFTSKSRRRTLIIKCMLHVEHPDPMIPYGKLFEEDRNMTQSLFIEVVRDQFLKEILEYNQEIEQAIISRMQVATKTISLIKVREAFFHVDPLKSKKKIEKILRQALSLSPMEKISWKQHIQIDEILFSLKGVLVTRTTRQEDVLRIRKRIERKREIELKNKQATAEKKKNKQATMEKKKPIKETGDKKNLLQPNKIHDPKRRASVSKRRKSIAKR